MRYRKLLVILYLIVVGLIIVLTVGDYFGVQAKLLERISIVPLGIGIIIIVALLLSMIVLLLSMEVSKREWCEKFRKYFGIWIDWRWFSKNTSFKIWRDKYSKQQVIIQYRIDDVLPQLTKDFMNACRKEMELMKPYFEESKGKINSRKALKKLRRVQRRISLTKERFQNATKVARKAGFKAEYKITEEKKIEKEKQEES